MGMRIWGVRSHLTPLQISQQNQCNGSLSSRFHSPTANALIGRMYRNRFQKT